MIAGRQYQFRYNGLKNTEGRTVKRQILLLQGPNLNLLGRREPQIYGHHTLADILAAAESQFSPRGLNLRQQQSNHEGDLVNALQEAATWANGGRPKRGRLYAYLYRIARRDPKHRHPGRRGASEQHPCA